MPRDCLRIIESKSKVRNSRNKPVVAKVSSSSSTPGISPDVAELKDMVKALLLDKKSQAPTLVKAVEEVSVLLITIPTTTSSPPKVVERETEVTKDTVLPTNNGSTKDVQPPVVQVQSQVPNSKPVVDPVSAPMPNLKPSIPYPSRRNDERRREKANDQIEKFYKIFQDMSFEISLADALILMPKFASTLKALIGNKEKLSEMARTPLNEHCSAVILNKLPEKLGDPGKFLIPCDFPGMDECLALADLGASINLMPLSVWKKLSLPELTPTCMTLELADRSITQPIGISWRKQRIFAFIKFSSCEQAQEAILRMHGKLVYGKHVSVYLAKTQLRSYGEDFQTDDVTRVKPCKCFSLQPISETTKGREISAHKISQWRLHGAIVQCRDAEDYNRLLQSRSSDANGFIRIQSMTERENYYSRFIWLEIKGIPFEYKSRVNISSIVEAWGKVLFIDQTPTGSDIFFLETCDPRHILEIGTISISNNTSLPICVSEFTGNPKCINVSSSPTTDLQPHIQELQPRSQRHSSGTAQELQILNSNYKSNSNGNMCGDVPIENFNLVDATDFLGGELLGMGKESDTSTSQANLYSQVFERVKDALSNETQGVKHKAILVDQEKACEFSISFLPQRLCSFSKESTVLQPSQTLHAPNLPSVPSTSLSVNLSPTRDSPLYTKTNPQSTSSILKAKSTKAPDCHGVCSKALRFAKIIQDKKSISKNKERDTGRMTSRKKKKCKEVNNNEIPPPPL
ncbi:reverse transcriptase domain-containing protein [Tanacetum coccineum]